MAVEFPYTVAWSQYAQHSLEYLRNKAIASGAVSEFDALVLAVNRLLGNTPLGLGKLYRSTGSIDERHATIGSLGIDFAVDVQRQFLLVRDCWSVAADDRNGS